MQNAITIPQSDSSKSIKKLLRVLLTVVLLGVAYFATPNVAHGQIVLTPTVSVNFGAPATGVAANNSTVIVNGLSLIQEYNSTTLAPGNTYSTGPPGQTVDLGVTADGLKTIELYSNGTFNIFTNARSNIGGGNIGSVSTAWGVSNSFIDQSTGHEEAFIGYTDLSSNKKVGLYDLTAATFTPQFTFTSAQTPSGLGNGMLTGGTTFSNERVIPTFNDNTFAIYSSNGSLVNTYLWDTTATGTLQDITWANGTMFGVTTNGGNSLLESANFDLGAAAVPEPSTYAAIAGGLTLLGAAGYRRLKKKD